MLRRKLMFSRWQSMENRPPFVPHETVAMLERLIATDPQAAVFEDTALLVVAPGTPTTPSKLQLLALRDPDNRPLQFGAGEPLGPIDMLAHRFPADLTHVMIWPGGFVSHDHHGHAPRLSRLSRFLRERPGHYVSFEQLYQPDIRDRLDDIRGRLRSVDIALTRPERVDQAAGMFQTLLPGIYGHRVPSVSVHLGVGRFSPRDRYLDAATEAQVLEAVEDAHEQLDQLKLTGKSRRTGKSMRVDLVNERLFEEQQLPTAPQAGSMPDSDAVFEALGQLYATWSADGTLDDAVQAQAIRPG